MEKAILIFLAVIVVVLAGFFLLWAGNGAEAPTYERRELPRRARVPRASERTEQTPVRAPETPAKPARVSQPTPPPRETASPSGALEAVAGQVVDAESGVPIPSFSVKFVPIEGRLRGRPEISDEGFLEVSDEEGRFRIEDLKHPRGVVVVREPGFAEALEAVGEGAKNDPEALTIKLEPAVYVEGFVVDLADRPVPGAQVFLDRLPAEALREKARVAESDDRGIFIYESTTAQALRFVIAHPYFAPAWVTVTPVPGMITECDVRLCRGASLQGRVWLGQEPLADQEVAFTPPFEELGLKMTTRTDRNGAYRFDGLPPCTAHVTVRLDGGVEAGVREKRWEGFLEDGQTVMADFAFAVADGTISGTVALNGAVPEKANLALLVASEAGEEGRLTQMERDGTFLFENVPPGRASVTVDAETEDGKMGFGEYRVFVEQGGHEEITFDLRSLDQYGTPMGRTR